MSIDGFKIVTPGEFAAMEGLAEGEVSVDRRGHALFRTDDLQSIGIREYAIVMVDSSGMRIALRAVRDGEQAQSIRVSTVTRSAGIVNEARRKINMQPALRELALEPHAARGRYEMLTKDDLLIIPLTGLTKDDRALADRTQGKRKQGT